MSVSVEDVRYVAALARLSFSPEEEEQLVGELNEVLAYVDQLSDLDTEDVPPMSHVLGRDNVVRPDVVEERISRDDALASAPDTDGRYFRVPKVIE